MVMKLIVVGCSWGGLQALRYILGSIPRGFEPSIAVAQHRSPGSDPGGLAAVLERHCVLPIKEVDDKDPILPGEVYLAPADYHLLVERGSFALSVDHKVQFSRPSVDVLFESAADAYGRELMGVVLTGANRDGAAGITRIKSRGGVTVAQDPVTAEKVAMPEAAIATGMVDHILPLADIGSFIRDWAAQAGERHRVN